MTAGTTLFQEPTTTNGGGGGGAMTSPSPTSGRKALLHCFSCLPSSNQKPLDLLIAKRKWTALSTRLQHLTAEEHSQALNLHNTHESVLSLVCRFHPPEPLLQQITTLFPTAVSTQNANLQYPLHIAASYGASPQVISHLCHLFPEAAGRVDNLGRTPLHLACSDYTNTYKVGRKSLLSLEEAIYQVVRELVQASPKTVAQEDFDRTSALEYGISANVDIRVINSIQKACERFYKSQSEKLKLVDPLIEGLTLNTTTQSNTPPSSMGPPGRMQKEKQTSMTNDSVETAVSSDGQLHSPIHTKEDDLGVEDEEDPSTVDSHATPIQEDPNHPPTRISLDEMRRFLDHQQQEEELQA